MADLHPTARFWMVCRKPTHRGAKTEPRQRYNVHADAINAAQKLARDNNHPFIVLEATEIHRPNDAPTQGNLL